jgi:hypothetical protein
VRPFLTGSISFDQPFHAPLFTVTDSGGDMTVLQLTPNQAYTATAGLEVGPPKLTFIGGLSVVHIDASTDGEVPYDTNSGSADFVMIGLGVRTTD